MNQNSFLKKNLKIYSLVKAIERVSGKHIQEDFDFRKNGAVMSTNEHRIGIEDIDYLGINKKYNQKDSSQLNLNND